ncbi:MAG: hypothetical protein A2020_04285 [Lentisphaerae bacterium GWF2_45_14]|nr:MAG: hypothetical protein A2020_04285 [Lentisphaerae bacterium GWF2_45_14]
MLSKAYKVLILSMGAALPLLCSSCGWFGAEINDQEVLDMDNEMKAEKRTTVFEGALRDLGEILLAYDIPRTVVQSKNVGNQTAEKNLPSDLYTMIAATISKVGPQIVFVPYDAQYVISEATTGGTITRLYPQVVIAGGITGFDKEMFEKEREAEASGGWAGAQGGGRISASSEYSRLTLDLNMLDYKTQAYFPGVIASNAIALTRSKLGWGVHAYYMGNGGSFDYELKKKQGVHAALRTLTEYSIIELLGKYFEVPYWRCVPGANSDDDMLKRIKDRFVEQQKERQMLMIKKMLFLHGFNGLDRDDPVFKGSEEGSLKEGMRLTSTSNLPDLYVALWKSVPLKSAARRVMIDRRRRAKEAHLKNAELAKVAAAKAADQENAKKAAAEEHRQKVEKYNAHITRADRLYQEKKYDEALKEYGEARYLFGGEQYPAQMINTISQILSQRKAADDNYRKGIEYADSLYSSAESASFNYTSYKKALAAYESALKLKPQDNYPAEKISLIKSKMSKYSTVLEKGNGDNEW